MTTRYGTGPYLITQVRRAHEGPEGAVNLECMRATLPDDAAPLDLQLYVPGSGPFYFNAVVEAGGRWWGMGAAVYHAALERKHWRDFAWQPDELLLEPPAPADIQLLERLHPSALQGCLI